MSFTPEKLAPLKACRLGIDTHHEPTLFLMGGVLLLNLR